MMLKSVRAIVSTTLKRNSCPALPCPALPCPVLRCPTLPCSALSYPTLPCPILPCSTLPCPTLPYPALSCLALPCPALTIPLGIGRIVDSVHPVPAFFLRGAQEGCPLPPVLSQEDLEPHGCRRERGRASEHRGSPEERH